MIFQNIHIITGNLGSDAKLDVTSSGKRVLHLSVATEYRSNHKGEQSTTLTWHAVTVWGALAERVAHWRKGDLVHIEGPVFERSTKPSDGSKPRKMRELWADVAYRIDISTDNRPETVPPKTTEAGPVRLSSSSYDWPV